MKKKILLTLLILLSACSNNTSSFSSEDDFTLNPIAKDLSIISPTGAPALAFYNYATSDKFETNSAPNNIVAMMNSDKGKDVVVIDTVSGIKAINNGANYKIAATLTFGNFYIASTGNDDDSIMNEGDNIILFGQGQTPDLIFHYLYGNKFDNDLIYVTNVQNALKCLVSGKTEDLKESVDYVFIAQPVLYKALNNSQAPTYGKASIYLDVQKAYKEKSNLDMIQASLFIKNSISTNDGNAFLNKIKTDVELGINDPELIRSGMNKIDDPTQVSSIFGVDADTAYSTIKDNNSLGLGFKKAIDIKDEIDGFMNIFGVNTTNEEIYYK